MTEIVEAIPPSNVPTDGAVIIVTHDDEGTPYRLCSRHRDLYDVVLHHAVNGATWVPFGLQPNPITTPLWDGVLLKLHANQVIDLTDDGDETRAVVLIFGTGVTYRVCCYSDALPDVERQVTNCCGELVWNTVIEPHVGLNELTMAIARLHPDETITIAAPGITTDAIDAQA
jgi:hypothetical protein